MTQVNTAQIVFDFIGETTQDQTMPFADYFPKICNE